MKKNQDTSFIAKNAFSQSIGLIFSKVIGYVTFFYVIRVLDAEYYGIYFLALTIITILASILCMGLHMAVVRYVPLYLGKDDYQRTRGTLILATGVPLILSFIMGFVLYFFSGSISALFSKGEKLELAIKYFAFLLPFMTVGKIWLEVIRALKKIKYRVIVERILALVLKLILIVIFFFAGLKLTSLLLSEVLTYVFILFASLYFLKKFLPEQIFKVEPIFENSRIIKFSIPLFLSGLFVLIMYRMDVLMLGYFGTSEQVGIYACSLKIVILLTLPLFSFNSIFAPVISEYFGLKQMQKFEQNFKIVTRWILILVLPFFVLILIFNSQIMGIFGDEFILGSMALVILSFGQLINSAVGPSGLVLSMSGNPKYNLLNSSLVLVMNFWLNYWLIPIYGIIGAAIATSTAFVVINLLKLFEVYYLIKVYPYSRNFYKPITAAFISGFMVYYLKKIFLIEDIVPSMFLALLLFILFVSIVFLLKIEPQDKELIYTIQRKFFKKG